MVSEEEEPAGLEGYRNSISPCLQGGKQHKGSGRCGRQHPGSCRGFPAGSQLPWNVRRAWNVAQIPTRAAQVEVAL